MMFLGKLPPWKKYPDLAESDLGWRMGYGEDYIDKFIEWWRCLSAEHKRAYINKHPAPEEWAKFYDYL